MIHKACPVALHPDGAPLRIPVFEHPQAGLQLVKGTIEPGEDPTRAAARELFEESGLETRAAIPMGTAQINDQTWHFALCRLAPPVRDRWKHFCKDDAKNGEGHLFKFHWHDINAPLPQPYQQALDWIRSQL